jgi:hypothetical protein
MESFFFSACPQSIKNSMFNSSLKTSAHLFGISPSTAKFLATYIINLFFITSSPMPCSSHLTHRECYQMTLCCLNVDLTKQALDDSNFATNPEQVIDNVSFCRTVESDR